MAILAPEASLHKNRQKIQLKFYHSEYNNNNNLFESSCEIHLVVNII